MYRGQTRTCRLPTKRQPDHIMLTPAKAGLYLGLDVDRVRALIEKGIINGTRVGRDRKVSMKELRAYKRREEAYMRKLGMTSTMANVMRLAERRGRCRRDQAATAFPRRLGKYAGEKHRDRARRMRLSLIQGECSGLVAEITRL